MTTTVHCQTYDVNGETGADVLYSYQWARVTSNSAPIDIR